MMVKSRATSVIGLMRGMNFVSYHSRPLTRSRMKREPKPAIMGMPR